MDERSIPKYIRMVGVLLFVLLLAGCATAPEPRVIIETKEVKVPVVVPRDPPPDRDLPKLPISEIQSDTSDGEVASKYMKTVEILMDEVIWYRTILYEDEGESNESNAESLSGGSD